MRVWWTFNKLEQYVKEKGYVIERTKNNEYKIVDSEGHSVEFFAVAHGSKPNREVKAPYVKKIITAIEKDLENDS